MSFSLLRLLLLLAVVGHVVTARELTLDSQGRYVDLLVSISSSQPEDWALVERVKEWLRSFSEQLSVATSPFFGNSSGLRLGSVSILVPRNWQGNDSLLDGDATWQSEDVAHLRLGRLDEKRRTQMNGTCGSPGDFVAFDADYVRAGSVSLLGKQLLQEFARFRWGVFSEHNEPDGPHFYFVGRQLLPVTCTKELKGKFMHNVTMGYCAFDRDTMTVEPNCRFFPDEDQSTRASLMSTTNVTSVRHFCQAADADVAADLQHHDMAPNLHNRICGGFSVAEVMRASPDFLQRPSPSQRPIQFKVVRPQLHRKVTIVMDVSGSMGGNKLNKMINAMENFVVNQLEPVTCSIVTFSSTSTVVKIPALLESSQIRREFGDAIRRLRAGGGTAIGAGIFKALEMLAVDVNKPNSDDTGYIVLVSDGADGNRPLLQRAAEVLRQTSIFVDTIAFGSSADKTMLQLSTDSSGILCFVAVNTAMYDITECLTRMVNERVSTTEKPITLYSGAVPSSFSIPVLVDATATNGLIFILNTYRATDIIGRDLKVSSPNGTVFDKNSVSPDPDNPIYSRNDSLGIITIRIGGEVQAGVWLVSDGSSTIRQSPVPIESVVSSLASVSVSSKSSVDDPVALSGSVTSGNLLLSADSKIVVTASLMRGAQVVRGAKILAKVESDAGTNAVVWLSDTGVEPDAVANDGVLAAYIPLSNVSSVQEYNVRLLCEQPVNRVTTAGKFVVTGVDAGSLGNVPPSTVRDLRVRVQLSSNTVTFTWTAVGDKQNEGAASQYLLKASTSVRGLRESFDSAVNVTADVAPLAAGSQQTVNVSIDELPKFNDTFFVALRAVNSRGVASGVSNVESLLLTTPDNIGEVEGFTTEETPEEATTVDPPVRPSTTPKAAPSTLASGVTVAVCLLSTVASFAR